MAGAATLDSLDRRLRRLAAWSAPGPSPEFPRFVVVLAIISALTAILVARIHGPAGPWLWNLDLPKIDFPLASFLHDAVAAGRLPLWNDDLGLGYPLYAEGRSAPSIRRTGCSSSSRRSWPSTCRGSST